MDKQWKIKEKAQNHQILSKNQKRAKYSTNIKENVDSASSSRRSIVTEEIDHPFCNITNELDYRLSTVTYRKKGTKYKLPDLNDDPCSCSEDELSDLSAHPYNEDHDMQSSLAEENEYEYDYEENDVDCGNILNKEYWDIGDAIYECEHCGAYFWYEERVDKHYRSEHPKFSLCCGDGKIKLPKPKEPPEILKQLLFGSGPKSKHFRENIRIYNSMFSFTSMGGKIDVSINQAQGPRTFKLLGQNYHQIGSLLPPEGASPKFAQLYICDTENEVNNRIHAVSRGQNVKKLHAEIVAHLKQMLDDNNVLAKTFRMVRDRFKEESSSDIRLRLIGKRNTDGRRYNLPTVSEVAALVVGDFEVNAGERDIIIETQTGQLQRINELNAAYLGLQYPLLFPYGEDGYREDISFNGAERSKGRKFVSMREYFAYIIQERKDDVPTIVFSGRLFQQFLVDAFTMIESSRMKYIRTHQKTLRADMYKGLEDAILRGESDPSSLGQRIIVPSNFVGGARYMIQNYQDAMAICKWAGYPDLFITFTCNPKWPEICRFVKSMGLNPEDRPDILCRVFKVKLDHLIKDLRDNQVFGAVKAVIYTIEFQKRGLPHAHILLFLHEHNKFPTAADIDKIISAEIPDESVDPHYYKAVQNFMLHGPCGSAKKSSPCMQNGRCTKHFPKKFVDSTTIDEDGYPVYRRRDDGRTITKSGIDLDNRFVVPHNRFLLLKYGAHINVEWCNQSRSIKYLFKYVNKGHDRVTAAFSQSVHEDGSSNVDEINMYYDCRYISPCEAAWRIFKFPIHHKEPSVERLSFHLKNEQRVVWSDDDPIDKVANRPRVKESQFLSWFEANNEFSEARELTYAEFPLKFVWKKDLKKWQRRKISTFSIGRIFFVPPGTGELYYLRLLLNVVKGPRRYEDLRKIGNCVHPTFRDACYALGLLDDDKEYVDAIKEASNWGMPSYLRQLFAMLLLSNSMSRPEKVWQETWQLLSEDILYEERVLFNNPVAELADDELRNRCLQKLERILKGCGKSFLDFPTMPRVLYNEDEVVSSNRLILDELQYDRRSLFEEHQQLLKNLTAEQKCVYDRIISAVDEDKGGLFFFVWSWRNREDIYLEDSIFSASI